MLRWERGTVKDALSSWHGVDRLEIELEDEAGTITAIAYRELTGQPRVGERVLLNTNALRRELGTGGDAMVVARLDVLPEPEEIGGHMVKARYTPMQTMVNVLDDPESEHYEFIRTAKGIDGMPVVVADPPFLAAGHHRGNPGRATLGKDPPTCTPTPPPCRPPIAQRRPTPLRGSALRSDQHQ